MRAGPGPFYVSRGQKYLIPGNELVRSFRVSDLESNNWPVFKDLTGPICARAYKVHICLG